MILNVRKVVGLLTALVFVGSALFAGDFTTLLSLQGPLAETAADALPIQELGDAAYDTQEGVHETITDTTGVEVDHYYVTVEVADEEIPVDPMRVGN